MAKRVAIVTGASSGMGREFALTAREHADYDELWIIARRVDRLEELSRQLDGQNVRIIPMDLSLSARELKLDEDTEIVLLVNAAGFGKFRSVEEIDIDTAEGMLDLNCGALMQMCYICLPYMKRGARILNIASVAAFQPIPYLCEYAATKAFVLSFSRGLWKELKPKGITVTALCPYWTKTEFFDVAGQGKGKDTVRYFNAMYDPAKVVKRGWRDLERGADVSTYGFIARFQLLLVKLLPHRLVMNIWCSQQKIRQK